MFTFHWCMQQQQLACPDSREFFAMIFLSLLPLVVICFFPRMLVPSISWEKKKGFPEKKGNHASTRQHILHFPFLFRALRSSGSDLNPVSLFMSKPTWSEGEQESLFLFLAISCANQDRSDSFSLSFFFIFFCTVFQSGRHIYDLLSAKHRNLLKRRRQNLATLVQKYLNWRPFYYQEGN